MQTIDVRTSATTPSLPRGRTALRRTGPRPNYLRLVPAPDEQRRLALVPPEPAPPAPQLTWLSARELEVLGLMAEGLSDRGIAERLWVTPKTVESHVRNIFRKLRLPAGGQHNRRVTAVVTYLAHGVGTTRASLS